MKHRGVRVVAGYAADALEQTRTGLVAPAPAAGEPVPAPAAGEPVPAPAAGEPAA
ncbi:hypothetical protein [Streptomyces mesophilus]|uniref:hypothetical protein n=1 Tax=Streptomyces mesophilus TaxID=1775132 RepID=UPI00332938F4